MTALSITPEFIARCSAAYTVTELEDRLLTKDAAKARKKEYLKFKSLLRFAQWKAIAVLPMLEGYVEKSDRKDIEYLTYLALEADTPDRFRIPLLSIIDGVGKPFASAILAAVYPDRFALMDARAVGVLFDAGLLETKNTARVPYEEYLAVVRMLASESGVSLHEVYRALYAYAVYGELPPAPEAADAAAGDHTDTASADEETSTGDDDNTGASGAKKSSTKKSGGKKSGSRKSKPKSEG